ncbi:hypothetical protein WME95_12105 [Sorangium sp. So ce327]|uniref:hypothetical protein n=1 Tax=Sorangium sp. So ce327 TaxID=3133301 RepID=UPI003F63D851
MMDKSIGAAEEAVMEAEEDVVELQLELDDLDVVAGGARPPRCSRCYLSVYGFKPR